MRILVTGGSGNVGRAAVTRLVGHGHEVRVIGRRAGLTIEGAEYAVCDVTDFGAVREQVRGIEAVVHLAAIPHPSIAPGQEVFRVNCTGTFNVYRAAADEGIRRVVSASSINALGYYFGVKAFSLRYLPVDEDHPTSTTDPYSYSKQVLEATAAYFWRREGISGVCLRLPAVYELDHGSSALRDFVAESRQACQEILALPDDRRAARAALVVARTESMRDGRAWEQKLRDFGMHLPDAGLIFGRSNFWTSIDARDSAQAIEKGLLADYAGCHSLFVNDSENLVGVESELLARTFFPDVPARRRPIRGAESLVSIDRARGLIGFEPEHLISQWNWTED